MADYGKIRDQLKEERLTEAYRRLAYNESQRRPPPGEFFARHERACPLLAWIFTPLDGTYARRNGVHRLAAGIVIAGDGSCVQIGSRYVPHVCEDVYAALDGAAGPLACRVACWGTIATCEGRRAVEHLEVLWTADASAALRRYAREEAARRLAATIAGGYWDGDARELVLEAEHPNPTWAAWRVTSSSQYARRLNEVVEALRPNGATDLAHEDARVAEAQRDTAREERDALASAVRAYLAADTYRCDLERPPRAPCGWCSVCELRAALARVDGGGT